MLAHFINSFQLRLFFVIFCILNMLGINRKAIFRHKLQITRGDYEVYIYIREGWATHFRLSPSSPYLVAMATEPPSTSEYEENIFFCLFWWF